MVVIYEAISNDIQAAAGGPMGSPIEENWRRLFHDAKSAKKYCEKDFGGTIQWEKTDWGFTSGDLLWVEYDIEKKKVK